MKCPKCGTEHNSKFCPNCGEPSVSELAKEVSSPEIIEKPNTPESISSKPQKFCVHCGKSIDADSVVCVHCGKQVSELKTAAQAAPTVVVNNTNTNVNTNSNRVPTRAGRECNKLVSFLLCLFLGCFGAHKFYEGKIGMGILYLFTGGLFLIGWFVDCIAILLKPNPYIV